METNGSTKPDGPVICVPFWLVVVVSALILLAGGAVCWLAAHGNLN